jgi:riboflavin-specific deaminase-like protein
VVAAVRQLAPEPLDVDDLDRFEAQLPRPAPTGRPWVLTNMIASVDGAVAVDGVSGPLGGPADRIVFRALRGLADVILVGAGTAREEGYRPPRVDDHVRELRRARGQADRPRLAVVTNALHLDPSLPFFDDPDNRPLVVTTTAAPEERRAAVADRSELVLAGSDGVDLAEALRLLYDAGARTVLAEGGPTLNGALVATGLVDEWRLTVSPVLAGGRAPRTAVGGADLGTRYRLDRVLAADDLLFLRFLRP